MVAVARLAPSVFSSRGFRQYFLGQSLSLLGDGLRTLAIPLFAYHLTHSALSTGASLACEIGPFSLFGLVGGSLADRLDRRKLMIACDAIRCAVMAGFAVAYAMHVLTMPMIYSGLVVISIAAAAFLSAQSSSIPYLVGKDRTTEAVAVLIGAENFSNLVMPTLGGALFAIFGPFPALIINAATYFASQLSLMRIPTLGPEQIHGLPSPRQLRADIALGFRTLLADRGMRAQAALAFGFNLFAFGGYSILIPFLKTGFAASDREIGFFLGVTAVGAVVGTLFSTVNARRWPFGRALVIAYLIDAFLFIPVVLTHDLWLAAACWAGSNVAASFEIAQIIGFRLRIAPAELVGRVMGAVRLVVLGGMLPGVLVFGWIADHRSAHLAMSIMVLGFVALAVVAFCTPAVRNEAR
ncbi:MAG TPA: MFS transporter [Candidatus Dormibacteraeota bacterium]|nr:MFS transporter [Candidatus Dormibacteraeota bacterium]